MELKWLVLKCIKKVELRCILLRADIDYCSTEALTKVGLIGIKVWICRGEVYGKRELAPNFTQTKDNARGNNGNNGGKKLQKKEK
jgi:small subunit ribosomal protein S3